MVQTRGKRTSAFTHAGGVVREIDGKAIGVALRESDLPHENALVDALTTHLCDRLAIVDAKPKMVRGSEKEIGQIEIAASELLAALKAYPDLVHLKHSIRGELFRIAGHMETDQYFVHWLLCLSTARERYFDDFNPTKGYHQAIVKIHEAIGRAGGNVAVHRTSRFVTFLERLEKDRPAMIFPPETVEAGRSRYVERALAAHSPN